MKLAIGTQVKLITTSKTDPLLELYSDESIHERYATYDGILEANNRKLKSAIDAVVWIGGWDVLERLFTAEEVTTVGSFLVHWNPESFCLEEEDDGNRKFSFDDKLVHFASDFVRDKIKLKSNQMTLKELQVQLFQTYFMSTTDQILRILFEVYAVKYISTDETIHGFPTAFKDFNRLDRNVCNFANMKPNVWYYPFDTSFPVCKLYGKLPNGKLLNLSFENQ
jgi:hypothetical protein